LVYELEKDRVKPDAWSVQLPVRYIRFTLRIRLHPILTQLGWAWRGRGRKLRRISCDAETVCIYTYGFSIGISTTWLNLLYLKCLILL